MPRKKTAPKPPPCPDPDRYTLVVTKEKTYWRLRRGLGKPAELNPAMEEQKERMKLAIPAARRIIHSLAHYLEGITVGRAMVRMGGMLTRELKAHGTINYSVLKGFNFHKLHKVNAMLRANYTHKVDAGKLTFGIDIPIRGAVVLHSRLADGYQFQLILLAGNPLEEDHEIQVSAVSSKIFSPGEYLGDNEQYILEIQLPEDDRPWMVFLKIAVREEGAWGLGPLNNGLAVIATGADGKALV